MSTDSAMPAEGIPAMSAYDQKVWDVLNEHWERRNNPRGLPNWAGNALSRSGEAAGKVVSRTRQAVPEAVKAPIRRTGDAVTAAALRPALEGAIALLELANTAALELNDPKRVEALARKQGVELDTFAALRMEDLKTCDRLLTSNILKWRTVGAAEGGAMGVLAMVPVAGTLAAISADILVIQVLSTAIAARVAYSYGYDARDPDEQAFIERLVRRSFMAQAAKAKPMTEAARAANAIQGRVRWSEKLRSDHRLLAAIEKLLKQLGPAGARVPVKDVAKFVPVVGILIGAGANAAILGRVAADAQRYCQTRFLCEKYGIPLPAALATVWDDEPHTDAM
ncbi:EcsC family protein [Streptomyces sp. NBC_01260]|uniref:EcsC family protein n=1 Tax=unclassified Streptomyces TaxID=2593676 RepID=UPI000F46A83A|nr:MULTISPECIES: EcsC family protein [unclassified Streptomyces]ROQ77026.1 EcsC family protein [Streptomyces sp. CEV 2-1]